MRILQLSWASTYGWIKSRVFKARFETLSILMSQLSRSSDWRSFHTVGADERTWSCADRNAKYVSTRNGRWNTEQIKSTQMYPCLFHHWNRTMLFAKVIVNIEMALFPVVNPVVKPVKTYCIFYVIGHIVVFYLYVSFYLCMCRPMYICTGFTTCNCPSFYAVILLINIFDLISDWRDTRCSSGTLLVHNLSHVRRKNW